MKNFKRYAATLFIAAMLSGGILSAQDEGTYIDNSSPQDSSLTEGADLNLDETDKGGSTGNTAVYIGVGVAVAVAVAVTVLRKKKKK